MQLHMLLQSAFCGEAFGAYFAVVGPISKIRFIQPYVLLQCAFCGKAFEA